MSWLKKYWGWVVLVILASGGCFAWSVSERIKDAYTSEWVAGHLIRYMEENEGRWPRNWEELRPIHQKVVKEGRGGDP
jgi:hypothetical protein